VPADVKGIGGFLPLELPGGRDRYHTGATALASGRACWHRILQQLKPRKALVPFFVCDAVLQPLVAAGIEAHFYAIDDGFLPELPRPLAENDVLLVVNYFGLFSTAMHDLSAAFGGRTVADDTQAFFRKGDASSWSFNSARKFFGVPDGGYLYGPDDTAAVYPPSLTGDCTHLISRIVCDDEVALRQYREHEARIGIDVRAMSAFSERLLAAVNFDAVRLARRGNFAALDRRLGSRNTLAVSLGDLPDDVPMCYPFLPEVRVDREALRRNGLFIPQFWPEIAGRADAGFTRERELADRLLPLPVDHRYGPDDMVQLCDRLLDTLSQRPGSVDPRPAAERLR
jgi:hypothetical protein